MAGQSESDLWTAAAVAGVSVLGAVTKSSQWVDAKTGKFSPLLMLSGVAVCLIMASIVHWAGLEKGIDAWTQIMVAGVLCYVGPDPIIRGLANVALKRIGVDANGNGPKGA